MTDALGRYKEIIQKILDDEIREKRRASAQSTHIIVESPNPDFRSDQKFSGFVDELKINLKNPCEEEPHPQMKEECKSVI